MNKKYKNKMVGSYMVLECIGHTQVYDTKTDKLAFIVDDVKGHFISAIKRAKMHQVLGKMIEINDNQGIISNN